MFEFDFTRKFKHRVLLKECNREEFVAGTRENCKCQGCNKYFQSKQGWASHVIWANPTSMSDSMKCQAALGCIILELQNRILTSQTELLTLIFLKFFGLGTRYEKNHNIILELVTRDF